MCMCMCVRVRVRVDRDRDGAVWLCTLPRRGGLERPSYRRVRVRRAVLHSAARGVLGRKNVQR